MAKRRRLSKRKITGWVLLVLAIVAWFWLKPSALIHQTATPNHKPLPREEQTDTALKKRLQEVTMRGLTQVSRDSTGIYVYDLTAHKVVYGYNQDMLLRPASCMKMTTCIAALRYLGPYYQNTSTLGYTGRQQGDSITGNLVFRFGYDLWFNDSCLNRLTACLQQKGIRKVCGKIVLRLAIIQPVQHEKHWIPGDFKLRKLNMVLRGEKTMKQHVLYALRSRGVKVGKDQLVIEPLYGSKPATTLLSSVRTPLERELEKALLNSSNENAEAVALLLGDRLMPRNKTAEWLRDNGSELHRKCAVRVLNRFLTREFPNASTLNPKPYIMHDGCGLCPQDRITPRFLVELFLYAEKHPYIWNALMKHLPVSGETGTLHRRMVKIKGRIQAKTGTLTRFGGITSLAGTAKGENGHVYIFAIIQNNLPVADARLFQDRLCKAMVNG